MKREATVSQTERETNRSVDVHMEQGLSVNLEEVLQLIGNLGKDFSREREMVVELKGRLSQGTFHLAVLGQFKRGKSTFLNALLGKEILPTSVVPLTAVPIFIRSDNSLSVKIYFDESSDEKEYSSKNEQDIMDALSEFVAEEKNPKNKKGVREAEVLVSADILSQGVVLIDTPGIGSTLRHNTEATLNFLPQCDAALFLISADPPITEVEVNFLKHLKGKVSRIFFIFNKVDYLDEDEREKVVSFIKQVLSEQAGCVTEQTVFSVSAKQGLKARLTEDLFLWNESGMGVVKEHLIDFCLAEKAAVIHEAVSHKAWNILDDIIMRIRLALRSLQMPLEELENRHKIFTESIQNIKKERVIVNDVLAGDSNRMHELLEEEAENLRKRARDYLEGIVRESIANESENVINEEAIQESFSEVIAGYFEHEFGLMTENFKEKRDEVLTRHQERVDGLIDTIRKAAAELFEIPSTHRENLTPLTIMQKPYWVTHKWASKINPIPQSVSDRFFSLKRRREKAIRRLQEQIDELLVPNVENVRWSLFQTMEREFALFSNTIDKQFKETVSATHGAIETSLIKRKEHEAEVADEVKRLNNTLKKFENLVRKFPNSDSLKA